MSFRNIRIFYKHYPRDEAGISGITSNNTVETDFPLENLIDDRQTTKMKFASVEADHFIDIDMGASFTGLTDRLMIPAGHSLDGIACVLRGDTFTPPTTSRRNFTPSGSGIIKEVVSDSETTKRHWRLEFGSGAHEIHGLILTLVKSFNVGFNMPDAEEGFIDNFRRLQQPSGISPTIQTGARQRIMDFPFERALETTDLATMEDWIATVGMHRPFYVDPPSFSAIPNTDDPSILCKFRESPVSRWGVAVPNTETEKKKFTLRLIESLD